MAKLKELLFGRPNPPIKRYNRFTDQQQQLFGDIFSGLQGGQPEGLVGDLFSNLRGILSGDQGAYDQFEAPLMRQFQEDIIPGIAERFAGLGTGGNLSSSGFRNAATRAGTDLAERLGALRANLRQGAMGSLGQLLGFAQTPQMEFYRQEPTQGVVGPALGNFLDAAGKAAAMYMF